MTTNALISLTCMIQGLDTLHTSYT